MALCTRCGAAEAVPGISGRRRCVECREINQVAYARKRKARLRAERVDLGLCVLCGKPAEPGHRQCAICTALKRKGRKTGASVILSPGTKVCSRCGGAAEPGRYSQCAACRTQQRVYANKSNAKQRLSPPAEAIAKESDDGACICRSCSKATPVICDWISHGDREGVTTQDRTVPQNCGTKSYVSHIVVACKQYKKGSLPKLTGDGVARAAVTGNMGYRRS